LRRRMAGALCAASVADKLNFTTTPEREISLRSFLIDPASVGRRFIGVTVRDPPATDLGVQCYVHRPAIGRDAVYGLRSSVQGRPRAVNVRS
jgi:hypothetical protein